MAGSNSSSAAPRAEDIAAYVETVTQELKGMVERHNLRRSLICSISYDAKRLSVQRKAPIDSLRAALR